VVGSVDPISAFEAAFDKKIRFFLVTLAVGSLFPLGFFVFLFLEIPGLFGVWFLGYVAADVVFTVVFIRWFRKRLEHVKNLPRAMRPRLASSGVAKRPTFVFDNGLVTTSGIQFRLFGSPMGGKMIPTSEEVLGLERGMMRMRPVLRIYRNRGPEALRVRLDSIQQALNARFSNLFVFLPRQSSVPDARRASWVSAATFDFGVRQVNPDQVLQEIDSLASLLEDAATMARSQRV
jgi:hypothetical protein